jgi:hypothetical protein
MGDRVDGRELPEPREAGSDALLLLGLLVLLRERNEEGNEEMGLLLVIAGLLLWLLGGYFVIGIVLIVLGLVLFFAWPGGYGYGYYRGRRGPV